MDPKAKIDDHFLSPGPAYWEDRCRVCSGYRDDHAHFLLVLARKAGRAFGLSRRRAH
jgi:hypothetical protein